MKSYVKTVHRLSWTYNPATGPWFMISFYMRKGIGYSWYVGNCVDPAACFICAIFRNRPLAGWHHYSSALGKHLKNNTHKGMSLELKLNVSRFFFKRGMWMVIKIKAYLQENLVMWTSCARWALEELFLQISISGHFTVHVSVGLLWAPSLVKAVPKVFCES